MPDGPPPVGAEDVEQPDMPPGLIGGGGATPPQYPLNAVPPPVGGAPTPEQPDMPPGMIGGGGAMPSARPPSPPGPEEAKLAGMIKTGPQKSTLGRIGAAALGAATGYVNAAGRTRVPVPTEAMSNMVNRAPGGGAWSTKLAQQQQLAGLEAEQKKSGMAEQAAAAQEEMRRSEADYYRSHADTIQQQARTADRAERDRQANEAMRRIETSQGPRTQTITFAKGQPPPVGYPFVVQSPYDKGMMIGARANPGQEIDEQTATDMGIPKSEDGRYYAVSPSAIGAHYRAQVSGMNAQQASQDRAATLKQRDQEFHERMANLRESTLSTMEDRKDRREARATAANASLDKWKIDEIERIAKTAEAQHEKQFTTGAPPDDLSRIYAQAADQMTQVNAAYARQIRDRGGNAPDYKVTADKNGNFNWEQTGQNYGRGGASTPPPVAQAPVSAPTPAPAPAPTSAAPAVPPQVNGGGRGAPTAAPPVAAAPAPQISEKMLRQKATAAGKDPELAVRLAKQKFGQLLP